MKYNIIVLVSIIIISIISYTYDINSKEIKYCINQGQKYLINIILYFHHLIVIFVLFGWLFNNKIALTLELILPIILLSHWISNNNKCVLTQIVNSLCGKNIPFSDIFKKMGFGKNLLLLKDIVVLLIIFSITFYKNKKYYTNPQQINIVIITILITILLTIITQKYIKQK